MHFLAKKQVITYKIRLDLMFTLVNVELPDDFALFEQEPQWLDFAMLEKSTR